LVCACCIALLSFSFFVCFFDVFFIQSEEKLPTKSAMKEILVPGLRQALTNESTLRLFSSLFDSVCVALWKPEDLDASGKRDVLVDRLRRVQLIAELVKHKVDFAHDGNTMLFPNVLITAHADLS
jgi:hypothetical protein